MRSDSPTILVITPVRHIEGVPEILEAAGRVTYMDDPTVAEVIGAIGTSEALFVNPNRSKVFIGREVLDAAKKLRVICTASTGTNHIDKIYAASKGLPILALTEEREVINQISSTAEHAFALMMAGLRKIVPASESVTRGEWDYFPYIGRQLNHLTIGVVGYGRLGRCFSGYCLAFNSKVLVYEPYQNVDDPRLRQVELDELIKEADVISLHVHVTPKTTHMVNREWLAKAKHDVLLVNTSRGEVCDEEALKDFLEQHPDAGYATDVLSNETSNVPNNPLRQWALKNRQVLITPHIGGMTTEAQQIAYTHAAHLLGQFFDRNLHGH